MTEPFDRKKEKSRAKHAMALTKWKTLDGSKIPQSEEGISKHRALVAEYERLYEKITEISRDTYNNTYAAIRIMAKADAKAEADNDRIQREYDEKRANEAKERLAKLEEEQERKQSAKAIKDAEWALRFLPDRIASRKRQIARVEKHLVQDEERVADLKPKLQTEEYKNSSLYYKLKSAMVDAAERVEKYKFKIQRYQIKVDEMESRLAAAKEVLNMPAPVQNEPVPFQDEPVVREDVTLKWRRKHPYYELKHLPSWATKVVGVNKPGDMRIKIFADELPRSIVLGNLQIESRRTNSVRSPWNIHVTESELRALGIIVIDNRNK